LRGRYKKSVLGWTWSLLNPLATVAIYSLVFSYFLKIEPPTGHPSGLHSFALFLLCALVPWNFFVRFYQPFNAGLHRLGKLWIYVSRGTGYWGPPKRLGAPSEITHLRLVPAQ